jgi:hypothetical protein
VGGSVAGQTVFAAFPANGGGLVDKVGSVDALEAIVIVGAVGASFPARLARSAGLVAKEGDWALKNAFSSGQIEESRRLACSAVSPIDTS